MAESDTSQQAGSQDFDPRAGLFDVLIRGLEMGRRTSEPGNPGEEPLELFCTYSYAEPGTVFCTLFYYHA
jgi:hypothetical protein